MERPSPVPPYFRVVEVSAWLNAWNKRAVCSGVIPIPLSRTENFSFTRSEALFLKRDSHHHLAAFGELHRIVDKVDEDLTQTQSVADKIRRQVLRRCDQELQILIVGFLTDHGGHVLEHTIEAELRLLHVQLPGLDF